MGGRRVAASAKRPIEAVIAERLLAARQQAGLTRAGASRASGIGRRVIEDAESGRVPISFLDSVALLRAYGVSVAAFGRQIEDALGQWTMGTRNGAQRSGERRPLQEEAEPIGSRRGLAGKGSAG